MNQHRNGAGIATLVMRPGFGVLRRYLVFAGAANLAWESAHLPLYTLWTEGHLGDLVFSVVHCTGGDLLITLSTKESFMKKLRSFTLFFALAGLVLAGVLIRTDADATVSLATLAGKTHFHGIAVDASDPTRLYLATHHGFFLVTPEGNATRLSDDGNDYMGFTPNPSDPAVFYASGHPAGGGNTGFIESRDGGRTWRQLSEGAGGPVDFHQMDVSRADPKTIYGVFGGLQVSEDGGNTWALIAKTPPKLLDLAASASDVSTLYAATENGLLVSTDRGQTWKHAHLNRSPATMVQAAGDGSVYAFVWGLGLLRSPDDSLGWRQLSSNGFGDRYLLHLAVDPTNSKNLYGITDKAEVLASHDGGVTWNALK